LLFLVSDRKGQPHQLNKQVERQYFHRRNGKLSGQPSVRFYVEPLLASLGAVVIIEDHAYGGIGRSHVEKQSRKRENTVVSTFLDSYAAEREGHGRAFFCVLIGVYEGRQESDQHFSRQKDVHG
jgi:hypothetical protein